ncbi:hypothetical protein VT98_14071, partial [Candidatus Electrothrix communis]
MTILALVLEPLLHLMPFGFIANSVHQGLLNILLRASPAENRPKVGLPVIKQAGTK